MKHKTKFELKKALETYFALPVSERGFKTFHNITGYDLESKINDVANDIATEIITENEIEIYSYLFEASDMFGKLVFVKYRAQKYYEFSYVIGNLLGEIALEDTTYYDLLNLERDVYKSIENKAYDFVVNKISSLYLKWQNVIRALEIDGFYLERYINEYAVFYNERRDMCVMLPTGEGWYYTIQSICDEIEKYVSVSSVNGDKIYPILLIPIGNKIKIPECLREIESTVVELKLNNLQYNENFKELIIKLIFNK